MRFLCLISVLSAAFAWGALDWANAPYHELLGIDPLKRPSPKELGEAAARARDASKRELGDGTDAQKAAALRLAHAYHTFDSEVLHRKYFEAWQAKEDKKFFSQLKAVKPEARQALFEKVLAAPRSSNFWFNALNMLDQEKAADRGQPSVVARTFALLLERGLPKTPEFERAIFRRFQNEDYYTELLAPLLLGRQMQVPAVVSGLIKYAPNPRDARGMVAAEIVAQMELADPASKKWDLPYDDLIELYAKTSFVETARKVLLAPGVPSTVLWTAVTNTPIRFIEKDGWAFDQYTKIMEEFLHRDPKLDAALRLLRGKPVFEAFLQRVIALANQRLDADPQNPQSRQVLENLQKRFPSFFPENFLKALLERCRKKEPPQN